MTAGDESERRVAEALRARATGAGHPGDARRTGAAEPTSRLPNVTIRTVLLILLIGGVLLGTVLALLSLLVPGLLPPLG